MSDRSIFERCRRPRIVVVLCIIIAAVWPVALPSAVATVGPPEDAGAVMIVDPEDPAEALANGGSATEFSLRLPEGATCPGDSAHDQWRIQSFIVPSTVDPGTLEYGVIGPEGDSQFALYAFDTKPFAHQLTRANSAPGQPGVIGGIPALSFAVFSPGDIPDGTYRIGFACTYFRATAHYWDTEIVVVTSADDRPAQFTWRLPDASPYVEPSGSSAGRWIVITAVGVVAVALAVFAWRRRPGPAPALSKEAR